MEQPINPQQFIQPEQPPKSKKIIWISLVSAIALIGVIIVGLYLWQTRLAKQNLQKTSERVLYKNGNDLILYSPTTKEKSVILSSADLLDFDLSRDRNFIVYSLKETVFEGNSDIYLNNLVSGQTTRLTEENNIASFNAKIFPDNGKVAYVRRIYNPATKKLSDGEIWLINADGNIESSKKLFGSNSESFIKASDLDKVLDDNGKWTGEYLCISKEEIESVKIGIENISYDGNVMSYWQKQWAPECSGLWKMPRFSKIDSTDFLTEKFKQQNTFNKVFNWEPSQIFWFTDGSFAVGQGAPTPIAGESIYYFDKDQNKKWEIFDSFKQDARKYDTQVFINDIIKKDSAHFIIVYNAYKRMEDTKYFVEELNLGDKIDLANLNSKKYFAIEKLGDNNDQIAGIKILNDNNMVYVKQLGKNNYGLYLYNFSNGKEEEIIKSNSFIDFSF
ncbi:MAG: hypothetical protein COU98_01210 [Candidatus Staskawiczbacteria bacterium CG10_big_fil_rev_8_21_14_0_10_38_10]|uniref:Dipeptidylpeptidase IV N-terminal domain-containing protein n=1 Tax=Candidatus Staskawiczbacteria bacterium CG10_big_fil_rev_8_21_14_0_10_38_10 TaxID=1974891 RepID=A0A2H9T1G4_9BACT|nr:MAG: hypothetical protein COU98_01210 [Candidatus Staskawiczbacteria bacterium CG10_big_fil_rev_8_21_14_0_10_38_10]